MKRTFCTSTAQMRLVIWTFITLGVMASGLYQFQQGAHIQRDILAMLPKAQENPLQKIAINRIEAKLAGQLFIGVVAQKEVTAIDASKLFLKKLTHFSEQAQHPFFNIESVPEDFSVQLGQLYFSHRFHLLSHEQQKLLTQHDVQSLIDHAQQALYSSFGVASSQQLEQDPLLLFTDFLNSLARQQSLNHKQGILFAKDANKTIGIIQAKGKGSVFNPDAQQKQLKVINRALEAVKAQYPNVDFLKAGALFHAAYATENAKFEISIIGFGSLIMIIIMILYVFRSVMPISMALLTMASAFLFAVVLTISIFGELHLITLVFGSSLVGISIDYTFHYYCERMVNPNVSLQTTVKKITPTVSLALLTSIIAYLTIAFTPFIGMQQVAVFCAGGLIGAFVTLVLAYPALAKFSPKRRYDFRLSQWYLKKLERIVIRLLITRGSAVSVLIITVCMSIWGVYLLTPNNDIRNLQQAPNWITEPEQQLRQVLSGGTDNQFILVSANNEQELLARLHQINIPLLEAVEQGELSSFMNLASYVPSTEQQKQNYQLLSQLYGNSLPNILQQMGLPLELAPALQQQFVEKKTQYLTLDALSKIPHSFFNELLITPSSYHNEFATIILLGGIKELDKLSQRISSIPNAQLVDQVNDISNIMAHFSKLTLWLVVLSLVIASAIFMLHFGMKKGLLVVAVPILAILLTLATLGFIQSGFTLFHALALLLVFGFGVDYSLFFAKNHHSPSVMTAVTLSAISTMLAFGLLSLSDTPAIHYFGFTIAVGIAITFLLAPFVSLFTRKYNDKKTQSKLAY
ncbi:transporter permease [Parashewanella curva]|uniref:Transporter permease n=1 Tax=Parashewanella curva TaxID=2338552 RepID=A0A3L8PZF4_9GAMM|nr:MMPL family transporter [Parashewanella curva]RLV60530.1 transporter permease [Parashewanella curva]